jgi:hypothetical protein
VTRPSSDRLVLANLIGLLAAAAFVRWLVLPIHGHGGDVAVVADWAERLAVRGPWNFYDGGFSIYPALLYLYWPFGVLFDNGVLEAYLKGQSILFDLAIGVVLFGIGRSWAGSSVGLTVAALYLFNPAVLLAGPIWGQIDAAGTLVMLGALMATAGRRFGLAGSLAILAGLTKPQFGLVLLPVLAVAYLEPGSGNRWRPIGRALAGGLLTAVVVMLPLRLTPMKLFDQIASTAASKPITSANAFNPWGVFFGFSEPDGLLVWVGAAALLIGLGLALIPLWRRRDLATLLAVGVFLVFAFYFLPTRVHERYLFPATALLAPLVYAAGSGAISGRLIGYATLSLAFAAGLIYALLDTTGFDLPPPLPDLWLSTPAIWVIGLTLMGSAVWWVATLWRADES